MTARGTLLVAGSNPPSQTSGERTLARVEQARIILGFEKVVLANLFALPTYRSGGVSELGQVPEGWLAARVELREALEDCSGVLLAYGVGEPVGAARTLHREQVRWLDAEIEQRALPTWWVGGAPRHPSRWQRYTWREFVDVGYAEALTQCLVLRPESSKRMKSRCLAPRVTSSPYTRAMSIYSGHVDDVARFESG